MRQVALGLLALLPPLLEPAWGASAGVTELQVTYQEVRSSSVASAAALLHRVARRERSVLEGSCAAADAADVQILQELGRPERWVRLEWLCEVPSPGARRADAEITALEALQVAPVQVLLHHELPGVSGSQRAGWAELGATRNAIYEVTHVDIGGSGVKPADVDEAIRNYISAARAAAGNLRAEAWRMDGHANHSTLLFVWNARADRQRFAAGAATRHFRDQIAGGLGAPYDDRLYRRID